MIGASHRWLALFRAHGRFKVELTVHREWPPDYKRSWFSGKLRSMNPIVVLITGDCWLGNLNFQKAVNHVDSPIFH